MTWEVSAFGVTVGCFFSSSGFFGGSTFFYSSLTGIVGALVGVIAVLAGWGWGWGCYYGFGGITDYWLLTLVIAGAGSAYFFSSSTLGFAYAWAGYTGWGGWTGKVGWF